MTSESQIVVPESFIALYCDARHRLTVSREQLAVRYELCEDLAQLLVEHCSTVHFRDGVNEGEVLRRCHLGLTSPGSSVEPDEAAWVVRRTGELLQWPWHGDELEPT